MLFIPTASELVTHVATSALIACVAHPESDVPPTSKFTLPVAASEPILEIVAVSVKGVPASWGEGSDDVSVVVDVAPLRVTVVAPELTALYVVSAALAAVTLHVPPVALVSVVAWIAQPVAVPFVTLKLTAPVPDPPDVVSVRGVLKTPEVEVTTRAACVVSAAAGDTATIKEAAHNNATATPVRHAVVRNFMGPPNFL
jgi:hypothetical protein